MPLIRRGGLRPPAGLIFLNSYAIIVINTRKGDADMYIIKNLSEHPALCVVVSLLLFFFSSMTCYLLLGGLLKMHRSKTAVKKLKNEFTLLQKLRLIPFETHCLHAVRFCKGLILFQKTGWILFAIFLLITLMNCVGVLSDMVLACGTVSLFALFDVPMLVLHQVFARPIIGRFKAYSFEKYHNTEKHTSLL